MSTLVQSRNEPATIKSSGGFRIGDAMNYQAWIAKAAKQPMVLETLDLGPLGADLAQLVAEKKFRSDLKFAAARPQPQES